MRKVLKAQPGKIFTNGEIFGRRVYLSAEHKESDFYEIPLCEYEKLTEDAAPII